MSHIISVGCEGGGAETKHVCDLKIPLDRALQRHVTATHTALVDQYSLVLRVDGELLQYGDEGLANLRFARTRRYIAADIQIPKPVWEPLPEAGRRAYIASQVQVAIEACIVRLQREGEVDGEALLTQVQAGVAEYLGDEHART